MHDTDQITPAPLTGNLLPAPAADGGVWTSHPVEHHMDLDTALSLLTPAEVDRIVAQARAPQISLTPTPGPGMIEAYLPGVPHPVYVHPRQPEVHTPTPIVMRKPVVDTWAVNTAVISLSLSTASLIGAFALQQAAIAAATLVATLASMGWFLLALAVVLGVVVVARKKATAPHIHLDQSLTQNVEITGGGFLSRTTVDPTANLINNVKR